MNDLVKVTYNKEHGPIVMGRDLHEVLGIRTDYMDWFPCMCGYGFTEGTDFISTLRESLSGCPGMDHQMTIEMAKRNYKKKIVRRFLSMNPDMDYFQFIGMCCRPTIYISFP